MGADPWTVVLEIGDDADAPETVGALTPDWMTRHLQRAGLIQDAQVTAIDVSAVGDHGLSGTVCRLRLSYDRKTAGAPAALVAKVAAQEPEVRGMLTSMGFYEREVRFYSVLAPTVRTRVPQCCFASLNTRTGASLLLLEDLSHLPALGWKRELSSAQAALVVGQLARLHAAHWAQHRLLSLPWLQLRGTTASDQVTAAFTTQWPRFLRKLSVPLTEEILDVGRHGARYLTPVSEHLTKSEPFTLLHNDVHGDNILLGRGPRSVVLLDWQLTTVGRGPVDLAGFLAGNLGPKERRGDWDPLVRLYHRILSEQGVTDYSLAQCRIDSRLAVLPAATRMATAIGSYDGLRSDPSAFWNAIFPRYASALREQQVADLCRELFG